METVAIVGVGLIGASFALALKQAGFRGTILGVSSPGAIQAGLERGAIDREASLQQAATAADLIYLAQPISRIVQTLATIDQFVRPGALITDAGSTKAAIVDQARRSIRRGIFLGGHPMAGKEKSGALEAEAGLFRNRTYVLTPATPAQLESGSCAAFLHWLDAIGARPLILDAIEHDRIVAYTSHLPQLLSTALALTVGEHAGSQDGLRAAGPGLLDTTRLAASSFEIWGDILDTNKSRIGEALEAYLERLSAIREQLRNGSLRAEFDSANHLSQVLRGTGNGGNSGHG